MPIENIMAPADEMDFAPEFNLETDFFSGGFAIPDEKVEVKSEVEKTTVPNWKFVINRAFMRGLTTRDILNSIGDQIDHLGNAQEIRDYMDKYEGLMGTVFLDISVFENGFPVSSVPKKFAPFHKFAINCKNRKKVVSRAISGGVSGDIDSFLNSSDRLQETTSEVCCITGLPILKKGMFNKEVIKELLDYLDADGETMKDLQNAMREKVLGIVLVKKSLPTEEADLDYGLKTGMEVIPDQEMLEEDKGISDIQLDYKASSEDDVQFNESLTPFEGVKLDDNLRF